MIVLHALRAKKLLLDQSEPWRLEDGLTSMIFGTLLAARAVNICSAWLLKEFHPNKDDELRMWFWPRLPLAEPDVIVQIENYVVVVEAKYGSDKHGHDDPGEPQESVRDQLIRQVDSVTMIRNRTGTTLQDLARAIENSKVLFVYLVDARRSKNAHRDFSESRRKSSCEDMFMVTWQDLYRLLKTNDDHNSQWIGDTCDVLELLGLDDFLGRWEYKQLLAIEPILKWAERTFARSTMLNSSVSNQVFQWRIT